MKDARKNVRRWLRDKYLLEAELISDIERLDSLKRLIKYTKVDQELSNMWDAYMKVLVKKVEVLKEKTKITNNWLDMLDSDERTVIRLRYCENRDWADVMAFMHWSQRACQIIEARAIDKILEVSGGVV